MRIGILGGSFNPVHHGHLELARHALHELNLEKVIFVPSYRTPLKEKIELLPSALRVRLLRAALKNETRFSISLCEIRRKGLSFTVDTLKYFRRRFGPRPVIFFLCGADTLKRLKRWKALAQVLRSARFVVMTRPGHALGRVPQGVLRVGFPALNISSSDIRRRLKSGKSVEALIPPPNVRILTRYFGKGETQNRHI